MSILKHLGHNTSDVKEEPLLNLDNKDHIFRERFQILLDLLKTGSVSDPEFVKGLIFDLANEYGITLSKEEMHLIKMEEKLNHEYYVDFMLRKIFLEYGIFLTALEAQKTIERLMYHFKRSGKTWEDFKITRNTIKGRIERLLSEMQERIKKVGYKEEELLRVNKEVENLKKYITSIVKVL